MRFPTPPAALIGHAHCLTRPRGKAEAALCKEMDGRAHLFPFSPQREAIQTLERGRGGDPRPKP